MARKNKILFVVVTFLMVLNLIGCSSKNTENNDDITITPNMELIYEETISPNKEYVEKDVYKRQVMWFRQGNMRNIMCIRKS